jgi:hypothetical protein
MIDAIKELNLDDLAEKFFLLIEALIRRSGDRYANGAPKIVSNSPHVPVQLSPGK